MKLTYVSAPFNRGDVIQLREMKRYCQALLSMGYVPLAPHLYLTRFLDYSIPEERTAGVAIAMEWLRRSSFVVICDSSRITDDMQHEINLARRLNKSYTTFEGLEEAHELGRTPR